MEKSANKVRVILEDLGDHPSCPHGPTLLFQRTTSNKSQSFYACSACRDRKQCNFFFEKEDWDRKKKKLKKIEKKNEMKHLENEKHCKNRRNEFMSLKQFERKLCLSCASLLMPNEWSEHETHSLVENVSVEQMKSPTSILTPLVNNKKEAQYLFSLKTTQLLVNCLRWNGFNRVICIGTPRIHEYITLNEKKLMMKSILLDIDTRLSMFYTNEQFIHYNLFNNHFFDGENSRKQLSKFVSDCSEDDKLVLMVDPPFGGIMSVIANTIKTMSTYCLQHQTGQKHGDDAILPSFLFFPYFNEHQIISELPSLSMCDYMVDYENHDRFSGSNACTNASQQGSIVRLFSNVPLSQIVLPESEGYHYCSICQRYVSRNNKHCNICGKCTSKDGREYFHCETCDRCVKSTWSHCEKCNRCHLIGPCGKRMRFSTHDNLNGHSDEEPIEKSQNKKTKRKK